MVPLTRCDADGSEGGRKLPRGRRTAHRAFMVGCAARVWVRVSAGYVWRAAACSFVGRQGTVEAALLFEVHS